MATKQDAKRKAYEKIMRAGAKIDERGKLQIEAAEIHMTLHGTQDKNELFTFLHEIELSYPIDVLIRRTTSSRSLAQNRTAWQWYRDAERQGDQTADEYRAICKLHCGIPILRRDSVSYREEYNRVLLPLPYESKLALMSDKFDFGVTRRMNVAQHSEFLDRVRDELEGNHGIKLSDPIGWDA